MKPPKRVILEDKEAEGTINEMIGDLYQRVGKVIPRPTTSPSSKVEKLPSSDRSTFTGLLNRQEVGSLKEIPTTQIISPHPQTVSDLKSTPVVEPTIKENPDEFLVSSTYNEDPRYVEGVPAPLIGDAIHFETTDGKYYRADPLVRRNVVGVKSGEGNLVRLGRAINLSALTANSLYYLKWPTPATTISYPDENTYYSLFYDATNFNRSQSFLGVAGHAICAVHLILAKVSAPTTYNVYLQIRSDDGTGKPSTTVLATSESIDVEDFGTYVDDDVNLCKFRFFNSFIMSAVTYHICILHDTVGVSTTNYVRVRGHSAGAYANGQMCTETSAGVWSASAAVDLMFYVETLNLLAVTSPNISALHPFDQGADAEEQGRHVYMPIIKLGRAASTTELDVNIQSKQTVCFLADTTTGIDVVGSTAEYNKIAEVVTYGVEKIAVLFRVRSSTAAFLAYLDLYWGGVYHIGTQTYQRFFPRTGQYASIYNTPVNGKYTLAASIYHQDAAGTVYGKYFSIIGG